MARGLVERNAVDSLREKNKKSVSDLLFSSRKRYTLIEKFRMSKPRSILGCRCFDSLLFV